MLLWLVSFALAAPPEGVMPDDAGTYEEHWEAIRNGPPGCWEVVGTASWRWDLGRFGASRGDAAFVARLEDGVWRDAVIRSLGEEVRERRSTPRTVFRHDELTFVPLVGRVLIPDRGEAGDNLLSAAFERLGDDVDYSFSEWDPGSQAVVLERIVPFGSGGADEVSMKVYFPRGGLLPGYLDVDFPERFKIPGQALGTVRGADARIRARTYAGMVFPQTETASLEVSVLGFRGSGAQTIEYSSYRPCGLAADTETKSILDEG